jgi:hypothetical protein
LRRLLAARTQPEGLAQRGGLDMEWVARGISVALALSLPKGPESESILVVCYMVVVFTIVVQGLTIERVINWGFAKTAEDR